MNDATQMMGALMAMSFVAWVVLVRVHFVPWADRHTKREALLIAVAPHMFRHIGAVALFPGVTNAPREWTLPLAAGDALTALLAIVAMMALFRAWKHALLLVWGFNVVGTLDWLHNAQNAASLGVAPVLGVVIYVVGFVVPGMLVLHIVVFRTLLRKQAS